MKIQKLLFPSTDTCDRIKMYYRVSKKVSVDMDEQVCRFQRGGKLSGNTYFNSFSIGKWRKYTTLESLTLCLHLKGKFVVQICHVSRLNGEDIRRIISEIHVEAIDGEILLPVDLKENVGLYYFCLKAESNGAKFQGGYYATEVDEQTLPAVKIAIGICTYKREDYIAHNVHLFREQLIENPDSPLYGNLEVYISDNGKSLPDGINSDTIHVFPNKNVGGSGGFARTMIEVMKVRRERGITHILMMDDDVQIEPHALELTYMILRLIREEYREAFIGGAMLRLDKRNIQHEVGSRRTAWEHYSAKTSSDLEKISNLLENEVEDTINYYAWWYCCMPASILREDNLPLPLFIKQDDIEFGLRNGREFINMNGICLWHEPFEFKSSEYLEYYNYRNLCIVSSIHFKNFTRRRLQHSLTKYVWNALTRYQYREAELMMMGVRDFLKGIDWFEEQDGERINTAVRKLAYQKVPVEQLQRVFNHKQYEKNVNFWEPKWHRPVRRLLFNGWLLPAKRVDRIDKADKYVVVPAQSAAQGLYFRAKEVMCYEDATGKAYLTQKSYRKLFYILRFYLETRWMVHRRFKRVSSEYRERCGEITNITFWEEYLARDGEEFEMRSGIPEVQKNDEARI